MPWLKGLLVAAVFAMPVAAQAQDLGCRDPAKPTLRAEMFFGRTIGGRLAVGERQWTTFLNREIAPRFPDGLTVIDAQGRWRDPATGAIVREPAKLVIVVTADDAAARERIAAAAAAYKQRFRQKSVGVVTQIVCAVF